MNELLTYDVDDLMVNTAGSMAGYGLARFAARFLPTREELDQQVSLLRRMLAFFYDMIACVVVGTIAALLYCSRFGSMRVWNYAAAWAAYFTLCPLLCRGQTLGHKMTRLKIVSTTGGKPRWFQYSVRYGSLLAGLALVPYLLNLCISTLAARGMVTTLAALIAYGIVNGGYLFFLLVEAVRMAIHRRLFYERWSRTKLESTIEVSEKRPS